jgi:hypothetical protein
MIAGALPPLPPLAYREPMLLVYPHGMTARFDPRGRYLRPGDILNGYVLDRFEVEHGVVLAVLRRH